MTTEGSSSALQRLLLLVAGVYLCSLAISLLFAEPLDYQRTTNCCDPRTGRGVGRLQTLQEQEAIAQQVHPGLEEVGVEDLAPGINRRFLRRVVGRVYHHRRKGRGGNVWGNNIGNNGAVVRNRTKLVLPHNYNSSTPTTASEYTPTGRLPDYNLIIHQEYLCHQVDDDVETTTPAGGGSLRGVGTNSSSVRPVCLLIVVHSHPGHKRRRNAIRGTWGRVVRDYERTHQVALVFALGVPRDYDEYKSVQKEARLYRDVIAWDFTDDYRNLTLKSLAGFAWATEHCPGAKFIMKADDDIYFNVPYLTDTILTKYSPTKLILGSLNSHSPVRRYGQWKVSHELYPQLWFPPYCSGCAYVISADMALRLYQLSKSSQPPPLIPIEDVYVTGLLAKQVGVPCQHEPQFPTWITVPSVELVQKYLKNELVGLHGVDWIRMHSMWHMIGQCPTCANDVHEAKRWLSWVMDKDPMYT